MEQLLSKQIISESIFSQCCLFLLFFRLSVCQPVCLYTWLSISVLSFKERLTFEESPFVFPSAFVFLVCTTRTFVHMTNIRVKRSRWWMELSDGSLDHDTREWLWKTGTAGPNRPVLVMCSAFLFIERLAAVADRQRWLWKCVFLFLRRKKKAMIMRVVVRKYCSLEIGQLIPNQLSFQFEIREIHDLSSARG